MDELAYLCKSQCNDTDQTCFLDSFSVKLKSSSDSDISAVNICICHGL